MSADIALKIAQLKAKQVALGDNESAVSELDRKFKSGEIDFDTFMVESARLASFK